GAQVAFPLPDAARPLVAVAEVGDLDVGDGDADVFASLPADHLAVRNVLPQILADLAADDLLEALLVVIDGPSQVKPQCLMTNDERMTNDVIRMTVIARGAESLAAPLPQKGIVSGD